MLWGWEGSRKKPGCPFSAPRPRGWTLQGAWSPARKSRAHLQNLAHPLSAHYQVARECDAVFVHTSTATHYQVVSELLNAGVHVCVDKPWRKMYQDLSSD
ncbi:Gfo/Idh/MocA family oxidoreductase [Enterobacter hormaechei]